MQQILFDFFGVLCPAVYSPIIKNHVPIEFQDGFLELLDELNIGKISEEELIKMLSVTTGIESYALWNEVQSNSQPNFELLDFIEEKLVGNINVGLLTNANRPMLERILGEELSVFDPQFISSDFHLLKPSKEIFEYVLSKLDIPASEILFIDDNAANLQAAKALGINTFQFIDNEDAFGFITKEVAVS